MIEYEYSILDRNWQYWIVQMQIKSKGIPAPDYMTSDGVSYFLHYSIELTPIDKQALDLLMSDSSVGLYPTNRSGFTIYEIKDLYDAWNEIEGKFAGKITYVFCNLPRHDYLELWIKGKLTATQKQKIKDAYTNLLKLVSEP